MAQQLSILIPVFNEEENLPQCLESLGGLGDEVFVVDSFSTDRTVELAKAAGARVVQHEYVNSAAQKNWAIPQCRHEWVFIIDADERMTPELREEIRALLARSEGPDWDGYFCVRRNYFLGGEIRHSGWQRNDVQRLFKRDLGRYAEREVHADVEVGTGRSGRLKGRLDHVTLPPTIAGLNRYFQRFNRYTTQAAERYHREGRKPRIWNFIFHPAWEFFRVYFVQFGILDGIPGLTIAAVSGFTRFVRYVKLYALILSKTPRHQSYNEGASTARAIDGVADAQAAGREADSKPEPARK
ncbi:MAG: glycosyltransferase family 2 protein [Planctomycetota bacterium]|nr:glycosyltransferase family 2 protein [Planctomycetota bacterium]